MKEEKIKKIVRKRYAKVAKTNGSCCASSLSCCSAPTGSQVSKILVIVKMKGAKFQKAPISVSAAATRQLWRLSKRVKES